jgi:16S rRNA (uracil1498-N3)-methyltransferase
VSGRRLFVPRASIAGDRAPLAPGDLHYLRDVLRLGPGAAVQVFDGEGGVHDGRLEGEALALGPRRDVPPPAARVLLAFALARGERCDLAVQKATELGAARLVPFEAARSVVRLDPARAADRQRRWQRIAAEAARQCGRGDVPEVAAPGTLAEALAAVPAGYRLLVFHEGGGEPLASLVEREAQGHALVVGPEGGLAPAELAACLGAGGRLATLGPRVLRFETAAIAAVALVQHLAGDLG